MPVKRLTSVLRLRCILGTMALLAIGAIAWIVLGLVGGSDVFNVEPPSQILDAVATAQTTKTIIAESNESVACDRLLSANTGDRHQVTQLKQLHLRAFFKSLRLGGYSPLQLRLVADLADVRQPIDALHGEPRRGVPVAYSLPQSEYAPLSQKDHGRVSKMLDGPGGDLLLSELKVDRALLRSTWREDPFNPATTVLGQLIRSHGLDVIRSLMDIHDVATFGLHEIAVAIELGISSQDLGDLLERANVDPSTTWPDRLVHRDNTLALVAALNLEPQLLDLLVQSGSDPSLGRRSVLDELPLQRSGHLSQIDNLERVVRVLLRAGDRPYLPSTLSVLGSWSSDLRSVSLHPDAEFELATTEIIGPAQELMSLVADWNRKVEEAAWVTANCLVDEVISGVPTDRSLAAKTRQQRQLDAHRSSRTAEDLQTREWRTQQLEPGVAERIDDVIDALAKGRWGEAIAMVDELAMAELYGSLLSTALSHGAEFEVIEALIERNGGALPPDAILMLASSKSEEAVEVLNELRSQYGLDIHFVNDYGMNAVSEVTGNYWDTQTNLVVVDELVARWLKYLANNSVTMKPSEVGLDPLDTVLLEMLRRPFTNRPGVRVARFLIDHGALIELSHRELVEQIAQTDFSGYRHLVSEVPELNGTLAR